MVKKVTKSNLSKKNTQKQSKYPNSYCKIYPHFPLPGTKIQVETSLESLIYEPRVRRDVS